MNTQQVVSPREIQRSYRAIINKVKRTRQPVFVGSYGRHEVVILPSDDYLHAKDDGKRPRITIDEFDTLTRELRGVGKQDVKMSTMLKVLRHDRNRL